MRNIIDKFTKYAISLANDENVNDYKFEIIEAFKIIDMITSFENLICNPESKVLYNDSIVDKTIKESTLCNSIFFIGSSDYDNLIKEDENARRFIENEDCTPESIFSASEEHEYAFCFHHLFEKDEHFLYKYSKFDENIKLVSSGLVAIDYSDKIKPKVKYDKVPLIIKKEFIDEYKNILVKYKDIFVLPVFYFFAESPYDIAKRIDPKNHNIKNKVAIISKEMKYTFFPYKEYNGDLVLNDFYKKIDYPTFAKEKEYYSKFIIINKNGEILSNDSVPSSLILRKIRHNIAHSKNTYYFEMIKNRHIKFQAIAFIIDDKAIIVPALLYQSLACINSNNYEINDRSYNGIYLPNKNEPLKSYEEIKNYLDKCKKIILNNVNGVNRRKINIALDHYLYEFEKDANNSDLKSYLSNNLKQVFESVSVDITPLKNTEFVASRLSNSQTFFNQDIGSQCRALAFIIKNFYNFDVTKDSVIANNGKTKNIDVSVKGTSALLKSLYLTNLVDKVDADANIGSLSMYRNEIYFSLCIFLVYCNFIWNKFNDDLEEEKPFFESLKSKLEINMFKGFTLYDSSTGEEKRILTSRDMQDVVDQVRNNVAHSTIKVKFSKSCKPEDNLLLFTFHKKQNLYYKISCKDFLTFINNPLFSNYNSKNDEIIYVNNYDELINFVSDKLK